MRRQKYPVRLDHEERERLQQLNRSGKSRARVMALAGKEQALILPTVAKGAKRSLLTKGHVMPIAVEVDGANRHDMKLVVTCPRICAWTKGTTIPKCERWWQPGVTQATFVAGEKNG